MAKCYVDGKECTCGAIDVLSDCPKDTFTYIPSDEVEDQHAEYDTLRRLSGWIDKDWRDGAS